MPYPCSGPIVSTVRRTMSVSVPAGTSGLFIGAPVGRPQEATRVHVGSQQVLGAGCLVLGAWCLVLGAWCLVLGAWCLVLGCFFTPRRVCMHLYIRLANGTRKTHFCESPAQAPRESPPAALMRY